VLVSRSLDSFYPVPVPHVATAQKQNHSTRQVVEREFSLREIPVEIEKKEVISVVPPEAQQLRDYPESVKEKSTGVMAVAVTKEPVQVAVEVSSPERVIEQQPEIILPSHKSPAVTTTTSNDHTLVIIGNLVEDRDQNSNRISLVEEKSPDQNQGFRDALPHYDLNPPPRYPVVARRRGWEGKVVFEAQIFATGRVGHLQMVVSTGYSSLDRAARRSIRRWSFRPATSFGVPVESRVEIPLTFSLK